MHDQIQMGSKCNRALRKIDDGFDSYILFWSSMRCESVDWSFEFTDVRCYCFHTNTIGSLAGREFSWIQNLISLLIGSRPVNPFQWSCLTGEQDVHQSFGRSGVLGHLREVHWGICGSFLNGRRLKMLTQWIKVKRKYWSFEKINIIYILHHFTLWKVFLPHIFHELPSWAASLLADLADVVRTWYMACNGFSYILGSGLLHRFGKPPILPEFGDSKIPISHSKIGDLLATSKSLICSIVEWMQGLLSVWNISPIPHQHQSTQFIPRGPSFLTPRSKRLRIIDVPWSVPSEHS